MAWLHNVTNRSITICTDNEPIDFCFLFPRVAQEISDKIELSAAVMKLHREGKIELRQRSRY